MRDSWLKKKLALTDDDARLDKLLADVCATMKADSRKHGVMFYYLAAVKAGKLASLTRASATAG